MWCGGEESGEKQKNWKCFVSCYQTLDVHVLWLRGLQHCEMLVLSLYIFLIYFFFFFLRVENGWFLN